MSKYRFIDLCRKVRAILGRDISEYRDTVFRTLLYTVKFWEGSDEHFYDTRLYLSTMKSRTSHPPLFPGPSLFLESRLYPLGYFYKLNWINVIPDIYAYLAKNVIVTQCCVISGFLSRVILTCEPLNSINWKVRESDNFTDTVFLRLLKNLPLFTSTFCGKWIYRSKIPISFVAN